MLAFFGAVVATGVGLIFWRGDRLRSPGSIDSPISREGAFLVNNLLFAAFALVVLIGTVFPLFVQALDNQEITVGTPYFDSMTVPIGFALLFFMAVAPVLPWRKAASGVLRSRLALPAWAGVIVVGHLCRLRHPRAHAAGGFRHGLGRRRFGHPPARPRLPRRPPRRRLLVAGVRRSLRMAA